MQFNVITHENKEHHFRQALKAFDVHSTVSVESNGSLHITTTLKIEDIRIMTSVKQVKCVFKIDIGDMKQSGPRKIDYNTETGEITTTGKCIGPDEHFFLAPEFPITIKIIDLDPEIEEFLNRVNPNGESFSDNEIKCIGPDCPICKVSGKH